MWQVHFVLLSCVGILLSAAQPLPQHFSLCRRDSLLADSSDLFAVDAVYAQARTDTLRYVALAQVGRESPGYSEDTGYLSTLVVNSGILNLDSHTNRSSLCDHFPTSCPYGPGNITFAVDVPFTNPPRMADYSTRIRILDPSAPSRQLACLDLAVTPYQPQNAEFSLFRWLPVSIAALFLLIHALARTLAARQLRLADADAMIAADQPHTNHSASSPRTILFDAFSGLPLLRSPVVAHFCTPSVVDFVVSIQRAASFAMLPLSWPGFLYTLLSSPLAWSCLIGAPPAFLNANHSNPFTVSPRNPAADLFQTPYGPVLSNSSSIAFLDEDLENTLLVDRNSTDGGMKLWAKLAGIDNRHLFPMAISIFLIVLAAVIVTSLIFFIIDIIIMLFYRSMGDKQKYPTARQAKTEYDSVLSNPQQSDVREGFLSDTDDDTDDENAARKIFRWKPRKKRRASNSQPQSLKKVMAPLFWVHFCAAIGNCIRTLRLFHFPLVIFSTYELIVENRPTSSLIKASFTLFIAGLMVPVLLIWRLANTPHSNLWVVDERPPTYTMLALGPLYTTHKPRTVVFVDSLFFSHSLFAGVIIGGAQSRPTVQAALLLALEVINSLATTVWLPWYRKASMDVHSFVHAVLRLLTSLLALVVAPSLAIGFVAAGWVSYVFLGLQAFILLSFALVSLHRLMELVVRIIAHTPFDESDHPRALGLSGAIKRRDHRSARRTMQIQGYRRRSDVMSNIGTDASSMVMMGGGRSSRKDRTGSESGTYNPALNHASKQSKDSLNPLQYPQSSVGSYSDLFGHQAEPPINMGRYSSPGSVARTPPTTAHSSTPRHAHGYTWTPQSSLSLSTGATNGAAPPPLPRSRKATDLDDGYIMSAWKYPYATPDSNVNSSPYSMTAAQQRSSTMPSSGIDNGQTSTAPNAVASTSANVLPQDTEEITPSRPSPVSAEQKTSGFSVVRGGKATGAASPYSFKDSGPPGRSETFQYQPPNIPSGDADNFADPTPRPKSQSAVIELDYDTAVANERFARPPAKKNGKSGNFQNSNKGGVNSDPNDTSSWLPSWATGAGHSGKSSNKKKSSNGGMFGMFGFKSGSTPKKDTKVTNDQTEDQPSFVVVRKPRPGRTPTKNASSEHLQSSSTSTPPSPPEPGQVPDVPEGGQPEVQYGIAQDTPPEDIHDRRGSISSEMMLPPGARHSKEFPSFTPNPEASSSGTRKVSQEPERSESLNESSTSQKPPTLPDLAFD